MDVKFSLLIFCLIITAYAREIEVENFQPDPKIKSTGYFDFGTLRMKKITKNKFSISGEFALLENSGDEKEIILEVRRKKDNSLILRKEASLCTFLRTEKQIWPDIQAASNFPSGNPCPMPKGKYWLKEFMIDEKKFAMAPPGDYKGRLMVVQNHEPLAAVDVDARLTI